MASSVDVVSALGHGLVTSQVGPSAGFDAIDDRRFWSVGLQEGAINAGSYEVTQRAAGANLSVDVAANVDAGAIVEGDSVTAQGLYLIAPAAAAINLDIAAANATNPRVDRVILEVKDDTHDVGGLNVARVRVVTGTATSGATLDNLTGAAAVPASSLLLADVHVPATDTTISNSQIRDRRTWARGAYSRTVLTSGDANIVSSTYALLFSIGRVECSGVPLRITARCRLVTTPSAVVFTSIAPFIDGAIAPAGDIGTNPNTSTVNNSSGTTVGQSIGAPFSWDIVPATGSHLIGIGGRCTSGTSVVTANATDALVVTIEEIVRQNTKNNATTTG